MDDTKILNNVVVTADNDEASKLPEPIRPPQPKQVGDWQHIGGLIAKIKAGHQ